MDDNKKLKTDPNAWLVIAIALIIIIIFFAWVIVVVLNDANATIVENTCAPGLCAHDIFLGEKRCPSSSSEQLVINPAVEKCTTRNFCQARNYTCALQPDQSVNCNGVCGAGNEECRCTRNPSKVSE